MIRCLSLEATESFSKLMAALSSLRPIMENWLPSGHGKEKGVACCTALSASVETKTITWRRRSVNLSCNLFYGWRSKRTEGLCALLKQVASRNVATGFPWMQYLTAPPPRHSVRLPLTSRPYPFHSRVETSTISTFLRTPYVMTNTIYWTSDWTLVHSSFHTRATNVKYCILVQTDNKWCTYDDSHLCWPAWCFSSLTNTFLQKRGC